MNNKKHPQFGKSVFLITVSIFVVLGLIFGCWGTVYAAQDSLPGDLLYKVKLTRENLQLVFTSDTSARIKLLTIFADRRMEEAVALTLQGRLIPEELPTLMSGYLEELIVLTANMDEEIQQEILEGVQRHLRPRDQDQGMTGPINSPIHDDKNPPPRDMNKNGKGQNSTDNLVAILTINSSLEITTTQTITPGIYGPGPCFVPECDAPLADEHSPGPYLGVAPGPGNYEGYGPGYAQGQDSQQTSNYSMNGNSNNSHSQSNQP